MPSTCRQRALTNQERQWLRDFKEKPSGYVWAVRVAVSCLIGASCCGGIVQAVFRELLDTPRSRIIIAATISIVVGGLLWQKFVRDERRQRSARRQSRLLAAESGVVEITELVFDRMWSITGHPDKGTHVLLELRPFVLQFVTVPADEDEHEEALRMFRTNHQPHPQINGTFPRRRLVLEHVRVPGWKPPPTQGAQVAPEFLLSMSWLDDRMEPTGEVPYEAMDGFAEEHSGGLYGIVHAIPYLVRGPWMKPPTDAGSEIPGGAA